jgi:hypothetical protein
MEMVESSAVSIAFKLQMQGYASEEKAVAALRRKHKGISKEEALRLVRLAGTVLRSAIRFLKSSQANTKVVSVIGTEAGQVAAADIDKKFRLVAPECSEAMRHSAMGWAQLYLSR